MFYQYPRESYPGDSLTTFCEYDGTSIWVSGGCGALHLLWRYRSPSTRTARKIIVDTTAVAPYLERARQQTPEILANASREDTGKWVEDCIDRPLSTRHLDIRVYAFHRRTNHASPHPVKQSRQKTQPPTRVFPLRRIFGEHTRGTRQCVIVQIIFKSQGYAYHRRTICRSNHTYIYQFAFLFEYILQRPSV